MFGRFTEANSSGRGPPADSGGARRPVSYPEGSAPELGPVVGRRLLPTNSYPNRPLMQRCPRPLGWLVVAGVASVSFARGGRLGRLAVTRRVGPVRVHPPHQVRSGQR